MGTEQETVFNKATAHIEVIKLKEGENYVNERMGISVLYTDRYLQTFADIMKSLLPSVASKMLDSSASSPRKVPAVSCGWSTANPHMYKSNRVNILGGVRPFLITTGVTTLPTKDKEEIAAMVCRLVKTYSPWGKFPYPFYHSETSFRHGREHFTSQFLDSLGASAAKEEGIEKYFQVDAISFILNNFVSFHYDGMNDSASGLNNTVSVSVTVKITEELSAIASVKKAMRLFHLDIGDPLSFAMLLYSRKAILDFIRKEQRIEGMLNNTAINPLKYPQWLITPLMKAVQRVNSDMNTNAIWDDPNVLDNYKKLMKRDKDSSQYCGYYSPIVAGFDKMRYWSPVRYLADVLHARNIVPMTLEHMMGYVCFAGLETNGTFLLSSIVDEALCTIDPRHSTFVKEVTRYGMYAALVFAGHRKNKRNGTGNIYGSSKNNRHQHHNRGGSTVPIVGKEGLTSFNNKDDIASHCRDVVKKLFVLCNSISQKCYDIRMKRIATKFEVVAAELYQGVQDIAGKGIGHIFALNFCQVASLFGFVPMEIVTWTCVSSKISGAYKAINSFYKSQNGAPNLIDLTEDEAQKHFEAAVTWISLHVSHNFSRALAENILCELHREKGEDVDSDNYRSTPKRDILYFYEHRKGVMHPLYRWKTELRGRLILQVLMVTKDGNIEGIHNLMHLQRDCIGLFKEEESWTTTWDSNKYVLSTEYCEYLL